MWSWLGTRTHPSECSGTEPICIRMPSRSGTSLMSGMSFLNRGDQVRSRGYVPAGMRNSAFSRVGMILSATVASLGGYHKEPVHGFTLGVISFEGDGHIQKNIKNYRFFIFEFSFEAPDEASEEALYR